MKKVLLAALITTTLLTAVGIASADDYSGKREMQHNDDHRSRNDNGLTRFLTKLGVHTSFDWDDDDDDDDDDDHEYGHSAAAPVRSAQVPDNGLFIPGSRPSANVQ